MFVWPLRVLFIRKTESVDILKRLRVSGTQLNPIYFRGRSKHFTSNSYSFYEPKLLFYKHDHSCKIITVPNNRESVCWITGPEGEDLRCQAHRLRIKVSRSFTWHRWASSAPPWRRQLCLMLLCIPAEPSPVPGLETQGNHYCARLQPTASIRKRPWRLSKSNSPLLR